MRKLIFPLVALILVIAACASSTAESDHSASVSKLDRMSKSELEATFAGLPESGSPTQLPSQAYSDVEDVYVGPEANVGGQFDNNAGGTSNEAGIFFQDVPLSGNIRSDMPPVNFNQDLRGRFSGFAIPAPAATSEQERIQRTGWIKLDVRTAIKFSSELRKLAGTFGATVTSFKDNEVVWKMPGAKLEALIDYFDLRKDVEILGYDFRSYDRTGDYYAIEARIKSAQTMMDRLNKLAEKAEKVEDLIKISEAIEHNMARVDGLNAMLKEIERRAGTLEVRIVLED